LGVACPGNLENTLALKGLNNVFLFALFSNKRRFSRWFEKYGLLLLTIDDIYGDMSCNLTLSANMEYTPHEGVVTL